MTSLPPPSKKRLGLVIDLDTCVGCHACTVSCVAENKLPPGVVYRPVIDEEVGSYPNVSRRFMPRPCMQCDEPPCVPVCPVNATYKRPDGIVAIDYEECIGCRYCQVACPYEARVFNWKEPIERSPQSPNFGLQEVPNRPRGVVEKCTFCSHRIDPGLERGLVPGVDPQATPACVVACPTKARIFGDLNNPESPVSVALAAAQTTLRLREELSTEPRVYYIPPQIENRFQGS